MEQKNNSSASAQDAVQCTIHPCTLGAQIPRCRGCRLEPGMEDLCNLTHRQLLSPEDPLLKPGKPKKLKGSAPDFWIKAPGGRGHAYHRDNSKYLGFYNPESVQEALTEGLRVAAWEYRAYKEDPDTPRRIYVGDDSSIRESELDNFKDGGWQPDSGYGPELVTPYDAGLDEDEELNQMDEFNSQKLDLWRQQGTVPHVVYQHSTHTNYVIAGSYSQRINKVVYEKERTMRFFPPWDPHPMYGSGWMVYRKLVRRQVSYIEDNTVMRKQYLPTLHPVHVGFEKCVVGSSTVMTKKDKRFLETRRYEGQVTQRHKECLIRADEVASRKQAATPAC